jgi:hypothetical protein
MRHAQSAALLVYWNDRRFGSSAPKRNDIEPQDMSDMLSNIFILKRIDADHHIFRLAGTHLCSLYQREFRDQNFLSLWRGHDVVHVKALIESVLSGVSPASLTACVTSMEMTQIQVEISLLPLRGPSGQVNRILGLFQPLENTDPLKQRPIVRTSLKDVKMPSMPGHLFTRSLNPRGSTDKFSANDR